MTEPSITPHDLEAWLSHVGRQEVRRQVLDVETLRRFAVAVGSTPDVEQHLPPLAHWAYFLEAAPTASLGLDGHPRRGGLLPPVSLPRRMFAASALLFHEPLKLGVEAELQMQVVDVKHRSGKTGDLVFVEVDRVVVQEGRNRIAERQTIVYRGAGSVLAAIQPVERPPRSDEDLWRPTSVELFRFSAATFNAHRIHYDLDYAQTAEGYPGLVVHGPLTAVKLCAFAQGRSAAPLSHFSFRAIAPLFADQWITLAPGDSPVSITALRCDGAVAMFAEARAEDLS